MSTPAPQPPAPSGSVGVEAAGQQDQFIQACGNASLYPRNLLRTHKFIHSLGRYAERLSDGRGFHSGSRRWALKVWDLPNEHDDFRLSVDATDGSAAALQQCMDGKREDPRVRFTFMQTTSSRGPLSCSLEQFTHIFSYHQVIPSALDLFLELRTRENALTSAIFRHEDYLAPHNGRQRLPALGRSGIVSQHAFNVLGFEYEPHENEFDWPLRHITCYCSFDMKTGKTFWVIAKGNKLIRERIMNSASAYHRRHPESARSAKGLFAACLRIHLLIMEWATESLPEYVNWLEQSCGRQSPKVHDISVEEVAGSIPTYLRFKPKRAKSEALSQSRTGTGISSGGAQHQNRSIATLTRGISSLSRMASGFSSRQKREYPAAAAPSSAVSLEEFASRDKDNFDRMFGFSQLQELHKLAQKVDQASMVIDQNKRIFQDVRDHIKAVTESAHFRTYFGEDEDLATEIADFLQHSRSMERDLDNHQSRIQTALRTIEKDVDLFNNILEYRSVQISEFLANSARKSSVTMERWTEKLHTMAVKTAQQTLSMHIITFFSLIFLPGTFISTFFSSNVMDFSDAQGQDLGNWKLNPPALKLFMILSAVLMFITISIWILFMLKTKRDAEIIVTQANESMAGPQASVPAGMV